MARLTSATGTIPLVTGIVTATALSGAAVFTVVGAGCDDPGRYRPHGGVVELIGGCITREDLPVVPARQPDPAQRPLGNEAGSTDPVLRP